MKRIFIGIFIVGILLSGGIYLWQSQMFHSNQMPNLTPDQLQQKIDRGENFYVYFYSPICEQCIKSEPKLIQAVQELMIKNIVKVDIQKYDYLRKEFQIQGTPTIFVYNNHKLIKGITGGFETVEEYKNFFQETGGTN
ncbi:thioredoxin family protein [Desulfosporosinus sp. PR]|uniref:thioredoxin family protein n=1 Tax=Candidatus Desulfosporosinus nitrosoreducens TaxID=3401928 RepID=UPI0027F1D2AA|nr:thioredoxin family protein [Desulfosporosinus sp. PR]MDQ7094273.1 thioredoxin family protein [Desulfosporosinus sp. PR]